LLLQYLPKRKTTKCGLGSLPLSTDRVKASQQAFLLLCGLMSEQLGADTSTAQAPSVESLGNAPMSARRNSIIYEKRGWCLKKSKTEKSWARAHHSHRYFVSRGHALSYYERQVESGAPTSGLRGVIDLREVRRIRPSADPSAPEHAIDLVLQGRTYVLVPQPASADEQRAWVKIWACVLPAEAIAPELLQPPGSTLSASRNGTMASCGTIASCSGSALLASCSVGAAGSSPLASCGGLGSARLGAIDVSEAGGAAGGGGAEAEPQVIMKGYLMKMPVKGKKRTSIMGNLQVASWKRRYFLLRAGMLQWFRDDPGADGEVRSASSRGSAPRTRPGAHDFPIASPRSLCLLPVFPARRQSADPEHLPRLSRSRALASPHRHAASPRRLAPLTVPHLAHGAVPRRPPHHFRDNRRERAW
jgi:hypothetical protein